MTMTNSLDEQPALVCSCVGLEVSSSIKIAMPVLAFIAFTFSGAKLTSNFNVL